LLREGKKKERGLSVLPEGNRKHSDRGRKRSSSLSERREGGNVIRTSKRLYTLPLVEEKEGEGRALTLNSSGKGRKPPRETAGTRA